MKQARRAMERLYNFLKENYGNVRIFWVAEPFDARHGYHTHALVYLDQPIGRSLRTLLRKAWQIVTKGNGGKENNHTVLKPYEEEKGARFYVSKYMLRKDADYDIF